MKTLNGTTLFKGLLYLQSYGVLGFSCTRLPVEPQSQARCCEGNLSPFQQPTLRMPSLHWPGKCHLRTLAELTETEDPVGKRQESPLDGNASRDGSNNTDRLMMQTDYQASWLSNE